jgi:predicted transcriptional regulator
MDKTTLYLPAELRRALADHARRTKRPQAAIVRDAIAAYVGSEPRAKLRSIGAGEDPELSGAASEDYLRARLRSR